MSNMERGYSYSRKFHTSVTELDATDVKRVLEAVEKYLREPDSPGLNLELLRGKARKNRLHTIRASDDIRVLLAIDGPTTVFLRAGHHDAIYKLADNSAFVVPSQGTPGLVPISRDALDIDGSPVSVGPPIQRTDQADTGDRIVEHWRTAELVDAGFSDVEVERIRRANRNNLLDVWPDIPNEKFDLIMELDETTPEEWRRPELFSSDESGHARFRDAIENRGAWAGFSAVLSDDELSRLINAPIEDWMIFLHPDQRSLVERSFVGAARVRGSAGTGKTVVALHRAAVLAQRFASDTCSGTRKVLFTTFVKSLPPVFKSLYGRLPNALADAVEFTNVDSLAHRICHETGQRIRIDVNLTTRAFNETFNEVVKRGSPLERSGLTRDYLREEITAVVKGRAVASLDEYLQLARTGRRTPFSEAMRVQLWDLHEGWREKLHAANVADFPDVILRARELARRSEPRYRAAVIDESQDITLAGLQLVQALVSHADGLLPPDGLFIVGDGGQKIYPGGFTLKQAGLDVRGSSAVLRVNYRNCRQIIDAAMACSGDDTVNDLGEEYARRELDSRAVRDGERPWLVDAGDIGEQMAFVARHIQGVCGEAVGHGDVGVFGATNKIVKQAKSALDSAAIPTLDLESFDGHPSDHVRIGTFHRAKGLEFKVVFLLGLTEGEFPRRLWGSRTPEERAEYQARQVSELFVAMTRARDALVMLYERNPSEAVMNGIEYLTPM